MRSASTQRLRGLAIISATVLFGISWTFAMLRVRTDTYPLLWALAMPPLAFYYFSGPQRLTGWKHLPAAALSIYAVVLWQVAHKYGAAGIAATVAGVVLSILAAGLGARVARASRRRAARC